MTPLVWVLAASLVVWGGFFCYLMAMENRVRRLEERSETEERK
jgi:hypothetical protein